MEKLNQYNISEENKKELLSILENENNDYKQYFKDETNSFKVYKNLITQLFIHNINEDLNEFDLLKSIKEYKKEKPYWEQIYELDDDELNVPCYQDIISENINLIDYDDGFFWLLKNKEEYELALEYFKEIKTEMFKELVDEYDQEILNDAGAAAVYSMYMEKYINSENRFTYFLEEFRNNIAEIEDKEVKEIYVDLMKNKVEELGVDNSIIKEFIKPVAKVLKFKK